MLGLLGPVWLSTRKTWLALPPWTSLALKARLRTRILFNNNAPTCHHYKEPFSRGLRMGFPQGDRVSLWLGSTRLWPAVFTGRRRSLCRPEGVHSSSLSYKLPPFPLLDTGQRAAGTSDKKEMLITSVQNSSLRLSMLLQERQKRKKKANYTHNFPQRSTCELCEYSLFKIACNGLRLAR